MKICQVEGGVRLAAHNEVAHQALEFLPLNYRWMSDKWAHQPEQCLMFLLDHMFQKSTILGDEKRLPPASYQGVVFSKMKIASNVAAQFVVSNHRIYQRPYDFWWKLFQVNNGNTSIASCPSRSYKEGTEVACAMERIWHNFFRDANPHTRQNFHADSKADSPLITEPLFMEDYPQCCKHFLPALLTTYPRPSSSNHQANILLLPESTSLSSFKHENRNNRHQQRTPILDVDNNNRQSFEISSSNSFQEKESKMRPSQQKQSQRQQRHRSSAPKSFRNF